MILSSFISSNNIDNVNNIIKGVFLLIIALFAGFINGTLGCQTQKFLIEANIYMRQLILFITIYFAMSLLDNIKHPLVSLKETFFVYIAYLLFSRMEVFYTMLVVFILAIINITHNYTKYNEKIINDSKDENSEEKQKIKNINNIFKNISILFICILLIVIVFGFTKYFLKQYKDHYKKWSTFKFIFGVNKCNFEK